MTARSASAIVIDLVDVAAGRCCCATSCRLDRRFPLQGYQLCLKLSGSGDSPDAIPLPFSHPDAPTAATAGVSQPTGRPVETRSRPIAGARP